MSRCGNYEPIYQFIAFLLGSMMSPTTRVLSLLLLALLQGVRAPLKLTSNFANDREYPTDNRGDEDNIVAALMERRTKEHKEPRAARRISSCR